MSVSVVIPAYRAERTLRQTLDSVLAQSMVDWEVVVIDDGSTDKTAEIARSYAQSDGRIRVFSQNNCGLAASRNKGLALSSPLRPFALFLDADDMLEPEALGELCALLACNPSAPAAHCECREVDASGQPRARAGQAFPSRWVFTSGGLLAQSDDGPTTSAVLAVHNCIRSAGAVLIRKTALTDVGLFDQSIAGTADWDMWFRLSLRGSLAYTPQALFVYRVQPASMSSQGRLMRQHSLRMRQSWVRIGGATRQLTLHGYHANLVLISNRQWLDLRHALAGHRWHVVAGMIPRTAFCLMKAIPGVAHVILLGSLYVSEAPDRG